jgi:DNA modification methylase
MGSEYTGGAVHGVERRVPNPRDQVLHGDVLEQLKTLPDNYVQTCVTSPPYFGLRSYLAADHPSKAREIGTEQTPGEYIEKMVEVFREVRRVLRPDGILWLNLGDSYANDTKWGGTTGGKHAAGLHGNTAVGRMKKATGFKSKDLMMIPARVAIALQDDGWWVRSDIVWCLSGGTRIYARTQKGDRPAMLRELARLDPATVQLWNGEKWTQVVAWTKTPRAALIDDDPLEIELRSGERIGSTPWHQWPTDRGLLRTDELAVGDIIRTCALPEPEEPIRPQGLDPIEIGWFVGLYLAEGSKSHGGKTLQFAGHQKETSHRLKRLRKIAKKFHGVATPHDGKGNEATVNVSGKILTAIIDTYIGGRTAHDKYLRPAAWKRSNKFLEWVLQGYLEGDGGYDAENDRWRLNFTRNYNLESTLRTLCARLGVHLRVKPSVVENDGRSYPSFRGEVRLTRSEHHNNRDSGEIVSIRRSRAREFWDVTVADEPHLFALASGVLTHNCKPNPMPESVQDRPTRSHEYVFMLTKSASYFYDVDAIREPHKPESLARYEYGLHVTPDPNAIKGSLQDRLQSGVGNTDRMGDFYNPAGRNRRTVWTINTYPFPGAHFATFPEELPRLCIKAGSSEKGACPSCGAPWERQVERGESHYSELKGERHWTELQANAQKKTWVTRGGPTVDANGTVPSLHAAPRREMGWGPTCDCPAEAKPVPCIVLDPFAGSGTTLAVAKYLGRDYLGIELNPAYLKIIEDRVRKPTEWQEQRGIFEEMMALGDD